jgi:hypothetical protein
MHIELLIGIIIGVTISPLAYRLWKVIFWLPVRKNWLRQVDELQMVKYSHDVRAPGMIEKYNSENPRWKSPVVMTEEAYREKRLSEADAAVLAAKIAVSSNELSKRYGAQPPSVATD